MPDQTTFVIAGAGLAGAKAAETLREEGFDGRVVLVGDEPEPPYERPPLSKGYLLGKSPRDEAQVHPRSFYAERDIELTDGVGATAIDIAAHRVTLADGRWITYDRLLLATGSVPRVPPIDGVGRDGVHVLRKLPDADALRERFARGGAVAVIGAGWIGCEVAAAAREHGCPVTLVELAAAPLEGVLGAELGAMFAALHRDHGVDLRTRTGVERIADDGVTLNDGSTVAGDTVVIGVGIAPDTRLAEAAGLDVDDGVLVDELLRTSAPDVFAAGDVASARHPRYGRHVRVEHWANALHQGPAAARSMLDRGEPYARLPYFFSDQYDLGLEYSGLHGRDDRLVIRGSLEDRELYAFWLGADGRVTAGMHVNQWDTGIEPVKTLIESGEMPDPEQLAQPSRASASRLS